MVSDAKFEMVSRHRWTARKDGNTWYAVSRINGKLVRLHRFVLGLENDERMLDHIDGDGLNCTEENLRFCNRSQNGANSASRRGTSRFKGVSYEKRNRRKWVAYVCPLGKKKHLGCFDTEEEAAKAYDREALKIFGQFARLNFPQNRMGTVSGPHS